MAPLKDLIAVTFDFFSSIAPSIAAAINNLMEKSEVSEATRNFQLHKNMVDMIFEYAPFVVYFKDQTGKYTRANHSLLRQLNTDSESDVLGNQI